MEISYAFFAEAAQITSDGRVNILGADLHLMHFQGQPPWTVAAMALVVTVRFEREECGRLYHFTADLIGPTGAAMEPHIENDIIAPALENPEAIGSKLTLVIHLNGLALPAPGVYQMHVRIADRERDITAEHRVRLRVAELVPRNVPA